MELLSVLGLVLVIVALARIHHLHQRLQQQEKRWEAEVLSLRAQMARLSAQDKNIQFGRTQPTELVPEPEAVFVESLPLNATTSSVWSESSLSSQTVFEPAAFKSATQVSPHVSRQVSANQGLGRTKSTPAAQPRMALPPGTLFALGGALLVLVGMAFVLSQLARTGFFTPQMQLAFATALAVALYTLSGRASQVVGEAMRGLGYGIAALCLGALSMRGVLAPIPVLGLVLLLSLLVGVHARARSGVLLVGVAVLGAMLSTWLLADNLPLVYAQIALILVEGALLVCFFTLRPQAGSAPKYPLGLTPLLPLGVAGLAVTAVIHGTLIHSQGALWAIYLLFMALGLSLVSRPKQALMPHQLAQQQALSAVSLLLAGLVVTGVLTQLAQPWLLLLMGAGLLAILAERLLVSRARSPQSSGSSLLPPDPLREGLLSAALGTVTAWLTLITYSLNESHTLGLRLLPVFLLLALYGKWTAQSGWKGAGALIAALLLLNITPGVPALLLALSALGVAARLGGRMGVLLAACMAPIVLKTLFLWIPGVSNVYLLAYAIVVTALSITLSVVKVPAVLSQAPVRAAGVALALLLSYAMFGAYLKQLFWVGAIGGWVAWLAFGVAALALPLTLHTSNTAPTLTQTLRWPWLSAPRLQQLSEWWGLLLCLLALEGLSLPVLGKGAVLLLMALVVPLLSMRQRWPWPVGLLLAMLYLHTCEQALSLDSPAQGLGLLLCTLLGMWALLSWRGRGLWKGHWAGLQQQATTSLDTWSGTHYGAVAACWGLALGLLSTSGFVLLAAVLGLTGLLAPHLLSATLGLMLSGLVMLWLARRDHLTWLWSVGLSAFGLAACKLLAFDLHELGAGARGLGLTAVGLLLLGIGQLAPKQKT